LPNRAFLQSANSNGNVTNRNYIGIESWFNNYGTTVFDLLSEAQVSWKIYHDIHNVLPTSYVINFPSLSRLKHNLVSLDELFEDLDKGLLPQFSLCEPRFLAHPSDYHPTDSDSFAQHNSLVAGEQLLFRVYQAIRASPLRDRTLFLVTFDEGGGLADPVPPPRTVSPYPVSRPTEMAFDFAILGQRVPFVAITSWVGKQTVVKQMFHHSSLIRSLCRKFNIRKHINARDRQAPLFPLFKTRKLSRHWPSLDTDLSLSRCVVPGSSVAFYMFQKEIVEGWLRWCHDLLMNRSGEDLKAKIEWVINTVNALKDSGFPIPEEPWIEVRFFATKRRRTLEKEEERHVHRVVQQSRKRHELWERHLGL
jgi:hypothetical protein